MIRPLDRKLAIALVRLKVWRVDTKALFGPQVIARRGTWWLFWAMVRRMEPDTRHHAPMCPANRWSGQALVFQPCRCGAR